MIDYRVGEQRLRKNWGLARSSLGRRGEVRQVCRKGRLERLSDAWGWDRGDRRAGKKEDLGSVALGTETREGTMCKRMPGRQAPQTVCLFHDKNYLDLVGWKNRKCRFLAIWNHCRVRIGIKPRRRRK